jgi:hypothetical protein
MFFFKNKVFSLFNKLRHKFLPEATQMGGPIIVLAFILTKKNAKMGSFLAVDKVTPISYP